MYRHLDQHQDLVLQVHDQALVQEVQAHTAHIVHVHIVPALVPAHVRALVHVPVQVAVELVVLTRTSIIPILNLDS